MNTHGKQQVVPPPRLIQSIVAGFNIVANNISLILFPVALDLFLWFGPHFRIKLLLEPFVADMGRSLNSLNSPEINEMSRVAQELWQIALERFNLASALRVYPVGVPSLIAAEGSLLTPLGSASIFEAPSLLVAILIWIAFSLVGFLAGCLFYHEISRRTAQENQPFTLNLLVWQTLQTFLLTVILLILLTIISIPSSLLISLLSVFSPLLVQIAIIVVMVVMLWIFIPLFFSPHSIFASRLNVVRAILNSARLVRFTLPVTGFFLMVIMMLGQGLDILWRVPPDSSWMRIVGIAGHAFISTALIAASFVYYRTGEAWLDDKLKKIVEQINQT